MKGFSIIFVFFLFIQNIYSINKLPYINRISYSKILFNKKYYIISNSLKFPKIKYNNIHNITY